jgi:glycosyltransferase involved in cell wall biosynthesis
MALIERALSDAGVNVTTLTTNHGLSKQGNSPRGPFSEAANGATRIFFHEWMRWYKVAPGFVPYLARHITSFDVVHIHALFSFSSTIAAWFARIYGVPFVIRPLGALAAYGMQNRRRSLKKLSLIWIEGPNLRAAAAIQFTSGVEMDEAKKLGQTLRGVVIPLGVEIDVVEPDTDLHLQYPALRNRHVVLFLSRIDPKKNVEALIDAFASREELKRTSVLLIAGSGKPTYVSSLKAQARALGLDDCIVWLGHLAGARKAAAFGAADVFVLPSLSENFGIAAVEAMLAGLPCVLSPGVAVAREAAAANAAMLAEPEASAVAHAIVELLHQGGKAGPMGPLARAHALACYSPRVMAGSLIELYDEVSSVRNIRIG